MCKNYARIRISKLTNVQSLITKAKKKKGMFDLKQLLAHPDHAGVNFL